MLTFLCPPSDLQRLQRQAAIQSNVDLVNSMTFESMADLLEINASEMGTLVLNIETTPYEQLLRKLNRESLDEVSLDAISCCALDPRGKSLARHPSVPFSNVSNIW
jgi:hypothetical protein